MVEITRKLETYGAFGAKVYVVGDPQKGLAYAKDVLGKLDKSSHVLAGVIVWTDMQAKVRTFYPGVDLRIQDTVFVDERRLKPEEGYPIFPELEAVFGREAVLAVSMNRSGDFLTSYPRVWVPERGLVIEDDPEFRDAIRETLEPFGFSRIDAARDRSEVEELLAGLSGNGDYDLITADCGLGPDLGFGAERRSVDLVEELLKKGEDVKRVIICSGDPSMGPQATRIGAKFVSKYRYHKDMNPAIIAALSGE